jgi:hypothetical protein
MERVEPQPQPLVVDGGRFASPLAAAGGLARITSAFTIFVALHYDLPIRDPDGLAGPAYIRLPLILAILFALDVVPRAVRRAHLAGELASSFARVRAVSRERWPRQRVIHALIGLFSFYLIYVSYRNMKSYLPFIREGTADDALVSIDHFLGFGHDPQAILHTLLGTGVSAQILSSIYIFYLLFVPLSLGAALVWSADLGRGAWYVTAMCVNWVLGAASYYILPSLGPVFARPEWYSDLPETGVSRLQGALLDERAAVLADPWATTALHGVAGFASLHVSIVFTAALVAQLVGLRKAVRVALWTFFVLTNIATIYFGWHYLLDNVGGILIGLVAVIIGALVTGQDRRSLAVLRGQR